MSILIWAIGITGFVLLIYYVVILLRGDKQ